MTNRTPSETALHGAHTEADNSGLAGLLARVEAATGADIELDEAISLALCDEHRFMQLADAPVGAGCEMYRFGPRGFHSALRVTASLDAALALVERVLPGMLWAKNYEGGFRIYQPGVSGFFSGYAKTPALALLAAMLKALIAKEAADVG